MRSIRIGIAGSGFGKRVLLPVFASLAQVEVVALSGTAAAPPSPDTSYEPFRTWEDLLARADLDAVALALPPSIQPVAAVRAFERGLHVFCEKPLALRPAAASRILEAAAGAGRVGAVDFEYRRVPALARLLALARELGPVSRVELRWTLSVSRPAPSRWKDDVAAGGGVLTSFGPHAIDLCSCLLGPLTVRSFLPVRAGRGRDGAPLAEHGFRMELRGADATTATISVDTAASANAGLGLTVRTPRGTLHLRDERPDDYFDGFSVHHDETAMVIPGPSIPPGTGRFHAVRSVAATFIDAVVNGSAIDVDLGAGIENTRVLAAARDLDTVR